MSNSILNTLITAGFFALFYLVIILPVKLLSKRKGIRHEKADFPKKEDWINDPADPLYRSIYGQASKKW
jgi:hypothetical protein